MRHVGQSLVEFALGTGVLFLILLTTFHFGLAMYHGHIASDAIRDIAKNKLAMADSPIGYAAEDLWLKTTTSNAADGNLAFGNAQKLDANSFKIFNLAEHAVVAGSKQVDAMGIPITFTTTQVIQRKLLQNNNAATTQGLIWAPPPRTPPWQRFPQIPAVFQCESPSFVSRPHALGVGGDSGIYLSAWPGVDSPASEKTTLMLASQEMGGCASAGGSCAAEKAALMPKLKEKSVYPPSSIQYTYYNPPGAPGKTVMIMVNAKTDGSVDTSMVSLSTSDNITAEQGFYIDPSGNYEEPPADYVDSCKKQRQAQCALEKAAEKAQEIVDAYADECSF